MAVAIAIKPLPNHILLKFMKGFTLVKNPMPVDTVPKKFSQSQSVTIHERIHTGDKPFACRSCNYKTTNSSSLKTHELTHVNGRLKKPNFKHESVFNDYDENAKNSYLTGNSCAKCVEKFDNLMDLAVHFNKK